VIGRGIFRFWNQSTIGSIALAKIMAKMPIATISRIKNMNQKANTIKIVLNIVPDEMSMERDILFIIIYSPAVKRPWLIEQDFLSVPADRRLTF
jgi:hypothetical protein